MQKNINIQNKKARFEFEIIDTYIAGIQLTGTEVKSLRGSKANIAESYATEEQGEDILSAYSMAPIWRFQASHSSRIASVSGRRLSMPL